MNGIGILICAPFLEAMLGDWQPVGGHVLPADAIAGGISPELAASVEVLICGETLDNVVVDALPCLRLVACFSTGYGGIDVAHLRSRGIALTTAAGVNAHDVADHAVALLLTWWHRTIDGDRLIRQGKWRDGLVPRRSLRGRSVGIVGLGRIGHATALRLAAHQMTIGWWGPHDKPQAQFDRAESLLALAEQSDALIVTSRAAPENAKQIDAAVLRSLGPSGVLINVSRGMLIDENALISALKAGDIGGAALDVFTSEPPNTERWRDLPNLVLSPHLAGYTHEAGEDMLGQLKENVQRHLAGEQLLTPLDQPVAGGQ